MKRLGKHQKTVVEQLKTNGSHRACGFVQPELGVFEKMRRDGYIERVVVDSREWSYKLTEKYYVDYEGQKPQDSKRKEEILAEIAKYEAHIAKLREELGTL